MPSENAPLPWMPCPKSDDGGHYFHVLLDNSLGCLNCRVKIRSAANYDYCNAAARHIAGLQREVERLKEYIEITGQMLAQSKARSVKEVERLKAQLAAIAKSPVPLTTARETTAEECRNLIGSFTPVVDELPEVTQRRSREGKI